LWIPFFCADLPERCLSTLIVKQNIVYVVYFIDAHNVFRNDVWHLLEIRFMGGKSSKSLVKQYWSIGSVAQNDIDAELADTFT